jgi:hypothetical protein
MDINGLPAKTEAQGGNLWRAEKAIFFTILFVLRKSQDEVRKLIAGLRCIFVMNASNSVTK